MASRPSTTLEQSLNTDHLYTHYQLTIPNENCRITMSGNYKLTVYDDNADGEDNRMLTACFMVVDPQVQVAIGYSSNTDIDVNKKHQQVSLNMKYGNLRVTNPSQQIKTVVLQTGAGTMPYGMPSQITSVPTVCNGSTTGI